METNATKPIANIRVENIRVLNPRTRSKRQKQSLMENIASVGLKKPITVSARSCSSGMVEFDLVCGQGRLEAVQALGYQTIPANIVEKTENECLVMSLVENIARRNHSTLELLRDIQSLRKEGYSDGVVAEKVGLSPAYLEHLMFLLDRGEERLITAVEAGTLPIAIAVHISRATDADVQSALLDAYEDGTLKGPQLATVRRLLSRRMRAGGKALPASNGRAGTRRRELAPDQLRRLFMRESERQKALAKRVELVHARLSFIVHALRELMHESEFIDLLEQEALATLPRVLDQRIRGERKSWMN